MTSMDQGYEVIRKGCTGGAHLKSTVLRSIFDAEHMHFLSEKELAENPDIHSLEKDQILLHCSFNKAFLSSLQLIA
jgi:hypothetical protein